MASLGIRGSTEESGVGEGSDNLSRYPDRVKRGITFTDTERTVWGSDVYPSSRERTGWGSDVYPVNRERTGWGSDLYSGSVRRARDPGYTNIPTGRHRDERRDLPDRGEPSIYTSERRKNIETMELKGSNVTDSTFQLPRIIVRDVVGRELDTFTTLQEAIYRAQWNVRTTFESRSPREWRLPKAPLPSRPDYSRQVPQNSTTRPEYRRTPRVAQSAPPGSVVEVGVEDVSFVAESLRQLPKLSTFHNLYSQISGSSDRIYFHIVARLLLHQKVFQADDKREALYEFPGFCKGCRRAGFCYGCNKGATFHVHHDQPVRTGGGYTYWKRDRLDGEDETKHPSRWVPQIPEEDLRLLLESEHAMSQAAKDALWQRLVSHYPWLYDIPLNELTLDKMKELGLVSTAVGAEVGGDVYEGYKPSMAVISEGDTDSDRMSYTRLDKILQTRDATRKKYTFKLKKKVKKEESDPVEPTVRQTTKTISRPDTNQLRGWDSDSMHDASNNVDSDKEEGAEYTTDTDSKKQRLYKEPRFFKVKKRQRQAVVSRSPFSTDRQFDIPKGRPLDIKKGNSSTTQFVEFQKSASNWKPPRKFELQHLEKKSTSFWQPRSSRGQARNKGQTQDDEANLSALDKKRREFERSLSPDSGLDSEVVTVSESLKESTEDNFRDSTQQNTETDLELPGLGEDQQYDSGKEASTTESPRQSLSPTNPKKQRSAIVKKERSPIQFTRRKTPEVTPEVTPEPEETKSVDDWSPLPPSREKTLTPPPQEQYIPNVGMPDLPQYRQEQKEGKRSKAQKFFVEGPPEMKAPQKKRKSPPKVRRLPKMHYRKKSRPAEAPMSAGALQEVSDPLDFLAKYCIINPNRLPFYEVIFENMVTDQTPRYERPQAAAEPVERQVTEVVKGKGKGKKSSKKSEEEGLSEHELKLARDTLLINHGQSITSNIGQNVPEEYREKIVYTLDNLQQKAAGLETQLTQLDMQRVSMLAESTRTLLPDVCAHDYVPPDKKKGKKGKKSKKDKEMEMATPRRRGEPIPDVVIVERLTDAQLTMLSSDPEVRQLNLERERTKEKIHDVHNRLQQLEGEKLLLDILSNEVFFSSQADNQRSSEFRRQQSHLYNKLRPDPDYELNLELVEEALQQINNHLLTDQEFKYLYFILDLPGRSKINFRLFSVIAALSEKVTQMDPVLRNLLNKFDYNALDVKMEKCKELFSLLEEDDVGTPAGEAPASTLALELTAGGLRPEHISYVLSKFNREGKGMFDFMDFVTYIPLFIEIHQRIVQDPLRVDHM